MSVGHVQRWQSMYQYLANSLIYLLESSLIENRYNSQKESRYQDEM